MQPDIRARDLAMPALPDPGVYGQDVDRRRRLDQGHGIAHGAGRLASGIPGDQHPLADRRDVSGVGNRSEEHTSELPSLMRTSYAVFCLKKKTKRKPNDDPKTTSLEIQA